MAEQGTGGGPGRGPGGGAGGATRNEGKGGGSVTNDEAERRETAQTGDQGTGDETVASEGGGSLLDRWDRATGVGQQFRSQRAASDALKERGET